MEPTPRNIANLQVIPIQDRKPQQLFMDPHIRVIPDSTQVDHSKDFRKHIEQYNTKDYDIPYCPITRELVHKRLEKNVLITKPVVLSEKDMFYRTRIYIQDNDFFFDHELNHIPGMLVIEAARQLGTAVTHLFLNVDLSTQFIIHSIQSCFLASNPIDQPTYIDIMIKRAKITRYSARNICGMAYIHCGDKLTSTMSSCWSALPQKIVKNF